MSLALALWLAPLALARGQEPDVITLEGRVIATGPGEAEIDRGRVHGLREGDAVNFPSVAGGEILGRIAELTPRTATVRWADDGRRLDPGALWSARIPASRLTDTGGPPGVEGAEHPPWQQPVGEWPADAPLLAPVSALGPADRATRFGGRFYATADLVRDSERGFDSNYTRLGTDLRIENPFGRGGALHADAEWSRFGVGSEDGADETDSGFRLDRLSYAIGGDRGRPARWTIGRFLQSEFPEFGVLDGAELGYRLPNGHRAGASFGYLPRLYGDYATGEDLQAAAFYRAIFGANEAGSLGAGVQKTWHEGEADRDLLVLNGSYFPREGFFGYATAWVDSYGSGSAAAADGIALTRLLASGGFRDARGDGWTVSWSSFRFPDLLAEQPGATTPAVVGGGEVRRADLALHRSLSARTRGTARVLWWDDDEESGAGGDLRWEIRAWPVEGVHAAASTFANQGRYSDVFGLRLDGGWSGSLGAWSLMWESARHQLHGVDGDLEWLLQHRVRAGWDAAFGRDWSLSVYLQRQFGDEVDDQSAGIYVQRSF